MEIKNYIGGKWITHSHLQSIAVTNPANGEQLATIPRSTSNEVGEAVAAAKQAQKSWALIPAPKRADYLYAIGQKMKEKKRTFGDRFNKRDGQGH